MNQIAQELGVTRHSVNRHARNCMAKMANALALASTDEKAAAKIVQREAMDLANSQREFNELLSDIVSTAQDFLERFRDSDQAKDIKAALDAAIAAARLLGDKQGAFPRASAQTVDNRSIVLSGLDKESLTLLIAGLKQSIAGNESN